jgi:protein-S-isoprenylcysteine O-methyltransferase Ste14
VLPHLLVFACPLMHLLRRGREGKLATTGPYAVVRHPQDHGFVIILLEFLLQRRTLLTILMLPVLLMMHAGLARAEEREVFRQFGSMSHTYAEKTPVSVPPLRVRSLQEL